MRKLLAKLELKRDATRSFERILAIPETPFVLILMLMFVYWTKSFPVLINPQFWAEDGSVFFSQALAEGFKSIVKLQAGYFVIIIRTVSWISTLFPLQHAPLICAIGSVVLQAAPLYLIFSRRTNAFFEDNSTRLFFALILLAGPASFEIFGTITNIQWYLPFWVILFLFSEPSSNAVERMLEYTFLLLASLTGPFVIFLFPLYVLLVVLKEFKVNYVITAIMGISFALQLYSVYSTPQASGSVEFLLYLKYAGTKIILNGLIGVTGHGQIYQGIPSRFAVVSSILIWLYVSARILVSGNNFSRLILILSNVVFFAGYRKVAAHFSLDPGVGARYAWLGVTGYLFFYYMIARQSQLLVEKIFLYVLCLAAIFIAIPDDFSQFNSKSHDWKTSVQSFRWLGVGDTLTVNIDPDPVYFPIVKKQPSDILKIKEGGDLSLNIRFQVHNNVLTTLDTWAFAKDQSASGNEAYFVLRSSDAFYVFAAAMQPRTDVAVAFNGDYTGSGFSMKKSIAHVKDGTYSLGLFINNNRTGHRALKYLTKDFVVDHAGSNRDEAKIYLF